MKLEQELDGVVVLVLPMELLGAVHAKPELQAGFDRVVFLGQLHVNAVVLLEEAVLQQVLDGVSGQKEIGYQLNLSNQSQSIGSLKLRYMRKVGYMHCFQLVKLLRII